MILVLHLINFGNENSKLTNTLKKILNRFFFENKRNMFWERNFKNNPKRYVNLNLKIYNENSNMENLKQCFGNSNLKIFWKCKSEIHFAQYPTSI